MFRKFLEYLNKGNNSIIISYKALRKLIGILGILLPVICIIGGFWFAKDPVQQSISLYYYTNMRDFLVGLLFLVGLFLITYKGPHIIDFIVTTITGIAGMGVAIFPCDNDIIPAQKVGIFQLIPESSNVFHLTFAVIFFLFLALNSLFLFTRSKEVVTSQKIKRNKVYIISGIVILVCLLGMFISMLVLTDDQLYKSKIILILESVALLAFGISWLIKGETILKDKLN